MPVLIDSCRGCSGTAGVRDPRRPAGSHGSGWRFSSRGPGTSRPNQAWWRTHPGTAGGADIRVRPGGASGRKCRGRAYRRNRRRSSRSSSPGDPDGNFTPAREVRAQFDTLVLSAGSRLPLRTALSRGTAHTLRIAPPRKKQEEQTSALAGARNKVEELDRAAIRAFTAPGKMSRLKSTVFGMLPYHRQAWAAGTLFSGVLQEPLTGPSPDPAEAGDPSPPVGATEAQQVHARLLTPISSGTARRGAPVEAVVTRPLFSAGSPPLPRV